MKILPATLVAALGAVPCAASAADGAAPHDVPLPAAAPEITGPPRVAATADGGALLALPVAGGVDVLRCGAGAWDAPVAAVRDVKLMVGARRGPRIAAHGDTVLLAGVTQRVKGEGGDLVTWRSSDGGRTWTGPARVNDAPGSAAEGFCDVAALGDGRFVVVWLDVKDRSTTVAAETGDGAAWAADVTAYASPSGSVCECCPPAVAAAGDGAAVVAFRNSVQGERDVWTTALPKGAAAFAAGAKSGRGAWKIRACPMAGPAVVVRGEEVATAWRREKEVFLAAGDAAERSLGAGTEPALAVAADGVHAVWIAGDALMHQAPGAPAASALAKGAAFPSSSTPASPKGGAFVTWFDVPTRRARLVEIR